MIFLLSVWLNFLFDYSSLFPFLFFLLLFYDSQRGVGVFFYRIMLQTESVGVVFEIKKIGNVGSCKRTGS